MPSVSPAYRPLGPTYRQTSYRHCYVNDYSVVISIVTYSVNHHDSDCEIDSVATETMSGCAENGRATASDGLVSASDDLVSASDDLGTAFVGQESAFAGRVSASDDLGIVSVDRANAFAGQLNGHVNSHYSHVTWTSSDGGHHWLA